MKKLTGCFLILAVCGIFASSPAMAAFDCSGPWSPHPPGVRPGSGGTCKALGLDTHRGVCQPGQEYETLCDDSREGYRICQGPRRCMEERRGGGGYYDEGPPPRNDDCRGWDYNYNQPCPRGYINEDCRGGCEPY